MLSSECLLVSDDDVDHFKMFHNSMEVGQMDATACEITTLCWEDKQNIMEAGVAGTDQFVLTVQNIDSIVNRTTVALDGGRHLPKLEVVGTDTRLVRKSR